MVVEVLEEGKYIQKGPNQAVLTWVVRDADIQVPVEILLSSLQPQNTDKKITEKLSSSQQSIKHNSARFNQGKNPVLLSSSAQAPMLKYRSATLQIIQVNFLILDKEEFLRKWPWPAPAGPLGPHLPMLFPQEALIRNKFHREVLRQYHQFDVNSCLRRCSLT